MHLTQWLGPVYAQRPSQIFKLIFAFALSAHLAVMLDLVSLYAAIVLLTAMVIFDLQTALTKLQTTIKAPSGAALSSGSAAQTSKFYIYQGRPVAFIRLLLVFGFCTWLCDAAGQLNFFGIYFALSSLYVGQLDRYLAVLAKATALSPSQMSAQQIQPHGWKILLWPLYRDNPTALFHMVIFLCLCVLIWTHTFYQGAYFVLVMCLVYWPFIQELNRLLETFAHNKYLPVNCLTTSSS
jgi:hypothetical protein